LLTIGISSSIVVLFVLSSNSSKPMNHAYCGWQRIHMA
jgi:hypothetical protein